MKVAIVAPSPVPFTIGGAEKLWWGLLDEFNRTPGVQAELIKLPSPEHDFASLMASYQAFSQLNLSHFNLVISTKYPAWMVQHPNHVCYLQHRLRGLYDTYHFTGLPTDLPQAITGMPQLAGLLALLGQPASRSLLAPIFSAIAQLQADLPAATWQQVFAFPGPLARAVVHKLDQIGSQPGAVQRYLAIAHNITRRQGYFPPGHSVQVVHHPSNLPPFQATGADCIFTVSRLDGAKRIAMLVQAYIESGVSLPFRIAGTGPAQADIEQLAKGHPGIQLLGRCTDAEIIAHYQSALFVPFIPYDEDYGLITIEAMGAGRCILTTSDSGGPLEFVDHQRTGYIAQPNVASLAQGFRSLCANPQATLAMGQASLAKVAHISWQATARALLSSPARHAPAKPSKPRLLVVVPYSSSQAVSGGQLRVLHTYRVLAQRFDVTLLALCPNTVEALQPQPREIPLGDSFREIIFPINHAMQQAQVSLHTDLQVDCGDLAMIHSVAHHPNFLNFLAQQAAQADAVVAVHPWLIHGIASAVRGKPLVYDSQNVELDMKAAILARAPASQGSLVAQQLADVQQAEQLALRMASLLVVCSPADQTGFAQHYTSLPQQQVLSANGVCTQSIEYTDWYAKAAQRQRMGLPPGQDIAFFAGSWHGPNIEAALHVADLARQHPNTEFWMIGTVCQHPALVNAQPPLPANLRQFGLVSDAQKAVILRTASIALNPMESGSGTNLKMLEYAAAGLNVVSTEFGNRGLGFKHEEEALIVPLQSFGSALHALRDTPIMNRQAMAAAARRRAESVFDWQVCARQYMEILWSLV